MADIGRTLGAVAVALLAASLPACLSPVPLDPKPQADLDPRLVGGWRCLPPEADPDDEPINITVAPPRERVHAVTMAETGKEADAYEAHGSTLGGRTIVNVRDLSGGEEPWDFVEYEFLRPNILRLRIALGDTSDDTKPTPAILRERLGKPGAFGDFAVCVPLKKE